MMLVLKPCSRRSETRYFQAERHVIRGLAHGSGPLAA